MLYFERFKVEFCEFFMENSQKFTPLWKMYEFATIRHFECGARQSVAIKIHTFSQRLKSVNLWGFSKFFLALF